MAQYGLFDEDDPDAALEVDENGMVEFPSGVMRS
jgi:hypothetical protein